MRPEAEALTDSPVAVVDVDVAHPLEDVAVDARYRRAHAVVRLHGEPVGALRLALCDGRLPADALRAAVDRRLGAALVERLPVLAAHYPPELEGADAVDELLHRAPGSGVTPDVAISVAVCTRDRPEQLVDCLRALDRLRGQLHEVLVVDNAPRTGATRALVCGEFPRFRYVREERPGLDWARNRAVAEARGEIVAFVDDDTVVDPGWAASVGRIFASNPEVAATTGLVLPRELETDAQLLFESNNHGFGRGFTRRWVRVASSPLGVLARHGDVAINGTGANMAFRRSLFAEIGGFDPALDVGTVTEGGGDLDMLFRVLKHGRMLVYEPRSVVWHLHRRGYDELLSQVRGWGSGMSAYLARTVDAYPEERVGRRILELRKLVRWFGGRFAASFLTSRYRRELVLAELRASFTGAERYGRARERAMELAREAGDASPTSLPDTVPVVVPARAASGTVTRALELSDRPAPLAGPGGAGRVRLQVTSRGRDLGAVTVVVHEGTVGADRARDRIARAIGLEILGVSWRDARRRVSSFLQHRS